MLWWMIGADELDKQVKGYNRLRIWQSARGISLLLFIFSAALTGVFVELIAHNRFMYADSVLFLFLGIFIYRGHRWAMIAGMAFWTLEKVVQVVQTIQGGRTFNFSILFFWVIYMHAMFLAYRVEQERRRSPPENLAVFD